MGLKGSFWISLEMNEKAEREDLFYMTRKDSCIKKFSEPTLDFFTLRHI